jgi:unsaturated chondroitin disaccharide hydrolase
MPGCHLVVRRLGAFRHGVEMLEARRLFAAGPLVLSGTGHDNTFLLREASDGQHLDVSINSTAVSQVVSINQITTVAISGPVNNTLTIDFSSGDPFPSTVSFTGGSGANALIITGINAASVQVNGSTVTFGSTSINYSATQSITVDGGSGNDTLVQTGQPSGQLIFNGGAGNDTLKIDAGTYTLSGDPASDANLTVDDESALSFAAAEPNMGINARHLAALNIDADATAIVDAPLFAADRAVLVLGSLSIDPAGKFDLTSNDMIVHNGDLANITSQLQLGFGNNSAGIVSSTAGAEILGVLQNTVGGQPLYTQFDNQASVFTDVLVKYTVPGDADLNGVVNGADYAQIDNGFGRHLAGWSNGDFNYDGVVDGSDYSMIDSTFNQSPTTDPLAAKLQNALTVAGVQMQKTIAAIGTTSNYPQYTNPNGTWSWVPATQWTAGFFPGSLWELYQATGDSYYKTQATKFTTPLSVDQHNTSDVGFQVFDSFNPLLAQSPGNASDIQVMLNAAAAKATQYNPVVGAFESWDRTSTSGNPQANFPVLMDLIMDSNLMFWAAAQTGNQTYYNEALQNAITEETYLVRPDGGSAQFAYFNSATGKFIDNEAYEGFSSTSTWSRGEAWGIYGFTLAAQQTGRADFLATAEKMADYFLAHLPADNVPYWDFNDPAIPNAPRDTSAAAVAASGLLQLSKLIGASDPTAAATYHTAAGNILGSLASPTYLADPAQPGDGILLHGALNVPANPSIPDNSLIFGDYYFLQAINEYLPG